MVCYCFVRSKPIRDRPLENLWGGGDGAGGRSTKKYSRKGKLNEKNSCTPINPKKYSCYGLTKTKKIPAVWKFPSPPHNFSNGPSLRREITKPQTATVISLWFWSLLAYPERYSDWPVHDQHSWKISVVHSFLSFSVKVHVIMYCQYLKSINQPINQSSKQTTNRACKYL